METPTYCVHFLVHPGPWNWWLWPSKESQNRQMCSAQRQSWAYWGTVTSAGRWTLFAVPGQYDSYTPSYRRSETRKICPKFTNDVIWTGITLFLRFFQGQSHFIRKLLAIRKIYNGFDKIVINCVNFQAVNISCISLVDKNVCVSI